MSPPATDTPLPGEVSYRIISMRRDGLDIQDIADRLGVCHQNVKQCIAREAADIRKQKKELVDEAFMLSAKRLELMWYETWQKFEYAVQNFDYKMFVDLAKVLLQIEARKSALMGLDANKTQTPPKSLTGRWDWLQDPQVSDAEIIAASKKRGWPTVDRFTSLKPGGVPNV